MSQTEGLDSPTPANFWMLLDESLRRVVHAASMKCRFPAGSVLISAGAPPGRVLILTSGWVKVVGPAPGGHEAVLAVRGPGDVIGEMAALDGTPRSATIVAMSETGALCLSRSAFNHVLEEHPDVGAVLLHVITDRLRYANVQRSGFADRSVTVRVAGKLTELADRHGTSRPEGVVIALRVSQSDIGGLVSASREAVARALRTLRTNGLISTSRRRIIVHDLDGLRNRAR